MNTFTLGLIVLIYLLSLTYLGIKGYRQTKTSSDYLLAGRQIHPFVMAVSYGATFISSSAIIGFGGIAANFGMGLIWLTFLNMFVGVVIAFIFFGRKTREMGHKLDAHTFPEFIGKSFNSKSIQIFAGALIFVSMPLYAAVVLKGGAVFIEKIFEIDYNIALFVFTLIIAAYVVAGGIKGVMYTDALQGSIMFISMFFLLFWTYKTIGMNFSEANRNLTEMAQLVPEKLQSMGHLGWTSMPAFGSSWWYTLVTSLIMGVGIGVLAQPQLVVRFMTVRSNKELNRAVLIGTVFIAVTTGIIYTVGAVSNIFFMQTEGKIAIEVLKDVDKIIPEFIKLAMPSWFAAVFMLTILSASMSTLSSQFHAMGSSIGRDVVSTLMKRPHNNTLITRLGVVVSIIVSYIICYTLSMGVIARGTAIFFGICAASFLPAYFCAIYWKRATRKAAFASMVSGFGISLLMLLFTHQKESAALGISQAIFGKPALFDQMPWPVLDPIMIALPISIVVIVAVSLLTPKQKAVTVAA
ncbi:MAG: sodium:solute symporter family protein [Prolixibacteraceae bacterium]|nr:sodium:solute symporter family protein [Prolixibacteraceae bacterium]MBN2650520.1 sodium:solute symporter family protein [Prolixibacteraceae bacterium]